MLFGEYHHSVDPKRRISVPAKLREDIGGDIMVVRSIRGKCLRFFSIPAWKEYIEPLKNLPRKEAEQTYWYLYHDAVKGTPDSLGRLLLTDGLLKFIGVDVEKEESRNVVLVGCGDYGEIWSEEEYNAREIDPEAIRLALEGFGL